MFKGAFFSVTNGLILAAVVCANPVAAAAQRRGASSSGAGLSTYSRPDGVDEKDSLKDFHHVLAVQATSQQITEFQGLVKSTEDAKVQLQAFLQHETQPISATADPVFNQTLASVLAASKKFENGFSDTQKSGLRDSMKRLDKADSDLEQAESKLMQIIKATAPSAEIAARGESVNRALSEFSTQQLALGREMSIVIASASDLTFILPVVKSPMRIQNHTVAVTVSGALAQTEEQNGQRIFRLELNEDLSDLQQNIGALLRAQIESTNPCGEKLFIRQAALTPSSPQSMLVLHLHYERWSCSRMAGQTSSSEIAEGDGTVEVKLTPAVEKSNTLKLSAEFGHIDASGMFAESLRSGDLGDDLREKVSHSILAALNAGMNFNKTLPAALQNAATIQSASFRDGGAGVLDVMLEGKTQISNEQANMLASQLNQALADKAATPQ
jgi:hypothetical protein